MLLFRVASSAESSLHSVLAIEFLVLNCRFRGHVVLRPGGRDATTRRGFPAAGFFAARMPLDPKEIFAFCDQDRTARQRICDERLLDVASSEITSA